MRSRRSKRRRAGRPAGGALGAAERGVRWAGISALLLLVVLLGVSTWRRHRSEPAAALPRAALEAFCVDVLNGNGRRGEAGQVASFLRQEGFRVESIENAERFDYPRSLVVDRRGDAARAAALAEVLGDLDVVLVRDAAGGACELAVILGHDWSLRLGAGESEESWDR